MVCEYSPSLLMKKSQINSKSTTEQVIIFWKAKINRWQSESSLLSALLSHYYIQWQLYNNPIIAGLLFFHFYEIRIWNLTSNNNNNKLQCYNITCCHFHKSILNLTKKHNISFLVAVFHVEYKVICIWKSFSAWFTFMINILMNL